jgi:ribonuclease BN (tRNA processing enzyme)
MRLRFLGCGDAFGSGGRLNTCFYVTTEATGFLIDCGASAMISLRRFDVDPNTIDTIFISHLHGDHFGGLPFFILDAQLYSRRETPLTIAGPPGLGARLDQAMEVLFPGSTAVQRRFATEVIELTPGQPARVNHVDVTPYLVNHPCGAPPLALRFQADGKVLAYTGDSQWTDALVDLGRDADLLIAEALFFDKSVKWHLDYATLAAHLAQIGAKRVILTHMGPDMLARRSEVPLETAEDGLEVMV